MNSVRITAVHVDGSMQVELHEHFEEPGRAVITVHGELDQLTEAVFDRTLSRTWDQWPDEVTVDLRAATFINARGLASLLRASHTARVRGLPLHLWCCTGLVARMVCLVGLRDRLSTAGPVPTVSEVAVAPLVRRRTPSTSRAARPQARAVRALHPAAVAEPTSGASAGMTALIDLDRLMAAAGSGREATLQVVLSHLRECGPGAEHSSFTRGRLRRLSTATTSSSPSALALAALQQRARQGPARDSQHLQAVVHSADLRCDTRWPELVRLASGEAVRSLLAMPVVHQGNRMGVVTLHSDQPHAFDVPTRELAVALVARAGTGLGDAEVRAGLETALLNRDVIGQGKGILMARHGVTAARAFELICEQSQRTNTRLVDVAEGLARTGDL